jgi:hypothetical protein
MNVIVNTLVINDLTTAAYNLGMRDCLRELGLLPKVYSQSEAERIFTKALVQKWRTMGMIEPIKTDDERNNKVLFDAQRLEVLFCGTIRSKNKTCNGNS